MNNLTKILMAFVVMLSLTTASKADFLVDNSIRSMSAINVIKDSKSSLSESNEAWKKIGNLALRQAYLKPMAFVEQKSVGSMFNEEGVYAIYFKTPFWGKIRKIHITITKKPFRIKVLQNKRTYNTLWPPGHFLGN
jgi:hypothetical protein